MSGAKARIPIEERLLSRRLITPDGCWHYTGCIIPSGYGKIGYQGKTHVRVHIVAYQLWMGPIPKGMELDHLCHTNDPTCPGGPTCLHRRCFNPADLEPVVHRDNSLRGRSFAAANAAKTHCKHGHALTEDNIYRPASLHGGRKCKTCAKNHALAQAQRRREAAAGIRVTA